ncbi:MazG-like nucleotide pyrophosphohydrolase [Streptomyces phage TunaTartare]|jgi:NTP pyrophosphatase (non-canonical NTP hydrolase)|uniref:MazG-like nucleotide pyrophosphohydrolase n=1 Tax=Streptomyces phage TunaTartare TaxID=2848887 RepID=A0A8F2E6X6_9CAUD|nr:MazG-like pyrophosphatase [Streptomyces phage TunaTartare]QWT29953.1 MazG-like nucleotide pyrophosphohydrolase [Streptomyces phage TunaTartare]
MSEEITFEKYQVATGSTAFYPGVFDGGIEALSYTSLGLVGEAGEIANKVKKILRDSNGEVSSEVRKDLAKELGDVLWYLARLADEIGYPLEVIAEDNLNKLSSRASRGVLGGSGDNR